MIELITKMPVMAQSRPSMASTTLRCLNMALIGARGTPAPRPRVTGSRMVKYIRTATMSPGIATSMKT